MKKILSYIGFVVLAVFAASCEGNNLDHQENVQVPEAKSYIQVDGGERLVITKAVKKTITAGSATTPNKFSMSLTAKRAGTNEEHVITLVMEYPFNGQISGPYSPLGAGKVLDKDLTTYSYNIGATAYGPYSNLTHGAVQISETGNNTYDISFSISPSFGPKPITGKYSGTFTAN